MTTLERPSTATPLTKAQAEAALRAAFAAVVWRAPTSNEITLLLAHSAEEVGQWQHMHGNNWGFVTTKGNRPYFRLPNDAHLYRWYATPDEGARDWLLAIRDNWPDAWALIDSGDPTAYVHALKTTGRYGAYFEADEATYAAGVSRLFKQFSAAETV